MYSLPRSVSIQFYRFLRNISKSRYRRLRRERVDGFIALESCEVVAHFVCLSPMHSNGNCFTFDIPIIHQDILVSTLFCFHSLVFSHDRLSMADCKRDKRRIEKIHLFKNTMYWNVWDMTWRFWTTEKRKKNGLKIGQRQSEIKIERGCRLMHMPECT